MGRQFPGVPRATNFIPAEGGDDIIGAIGNQLVPPFNEFYPNKRRKCLRMVLLVTS